MTRKLFVVEEKRFQFTAPRIRETPLMLSHHIPKYNGIRLMYILFRKTAYRTLFLNIYVYSSSVEPR